jgi:hypothetical protein
MGGGIGSLLLAGLGRWWEQVQGVDGAIAAAFFLLAILNRPLLSYLEKARDKHIKRLPLKFPVAALVLWIGWHVLAAAHTRITAAESDVATLKNRSAPTPVTIPLDPNPQLSAKIAEQEGTITRLTSENRDRQREIDDLRETLDGLRAQLGQQSAAADDSRKRAAIRQQLAAYMDGGRQLLNKYIASDAAPEMEKKLNEWYAESLRYISDQMGADYAAQYRQTTSSGLGINGFPVAKMGVVDAINSRLRHLNTFIDRLR